MNEPVCCECGKIYPDADARWDAIPGWGILLDDLLLCGRDCAALFAKKTRNRSWTEISVVWNRPPKPLLDPEARMVCIFLEREIASTRRSRKWEYEYPDRSTGDTFHRAQAMKIAVNVLGLLASGTKIVAYLVYKPKDATGVSWAIQEQESVDLSARMGVDYKSRLEADKALGN